MKLSVISVGFCAVVGVLAQGSLSGNELDAILRRLKVDADGLVHAGNDGILRSFDGEGRVIDIAKLDNGHLTTMASWFPGQKEGLMNVWQNVDSSKVDESQIWSPPSDLVPALFSDPERLGQNDQNERTPTLEDRDCIEYRCQTSRFCQSVGCYLCLHVSDNGHLPHCLGTD